MLYIPVPVNMEIFVIGKYLQILENLNLCQKKEEKKSQKTIDLKKKTTDFVMHSELYCILGILSFFFPAEITSTSTLLTVELKNGMSRSCYCL